jgi:hypothetical protein
MEEADSFEPAEQEKQKVAEDIIKPEQSPFVTTDPKPA